MLIAYLYTTRTSKALHLRVRQESFRDDLKDKLQRIGSPARWLMADQAWDCPLSPESVVRLAEIAREAGEQVEWRDGLREYADQHLKQSDYEHEVRMAIERVIRDGTALEPYATLMFTAHGKPCPPLRHQQVLYHWSQRCRGVFLAWEMGTGKTRAGADASGGWYRNGQIPPMQATVIDGKPAVAGGVLIVCPRTMLKTWQVELAQWQNATSIIVGGTAQRKMRMAGRVAHYHIINYESLKYVTHNRYAGIILDEIHKAANATTQSELSRQIAERCSKRLGLTGTPISNDLKSVFYPMLAIDGGRALGPSRTAFLEKFFTASKGAAGFMEYDAKQDAPTQIAKAMATTCYFVKKADVLDLPSKTHTPIYLPMTEEQKRYYNEVRKDALVYMQDDTITLEAAQARMMKLLQVCQGFALTDDGKGRHFTDAKTDALVEMLTDQLHGRKVIVWAMFQYEIDRLQQKLRDAGISHIALDGRVTSQRDRDAQVERWNTDPDLHVYVRQLSMCEGVTLLGPPSNPCSTTIYLALNYNMVHLLQSQDRIHRIGQHHNCSYLYLLCDGAVDCRVYDRLLDKIDNAEAVQQTGKQWYRHLLESADFTPAATAEVA